MWASLRTSAYLMCVVEKTVPPGGWGGYLTLIQNWSLPIFNFHQRSPGYGRNSIAKPIIALNDVFIHSIVICFPFECPPSLINRIVWGKAECQGDDHTSFVTFSANPQSHKLVIFNPPKVVHSVKKEQPTINKETGYESSQKPTNALRNAH